MLAGAVSMLFTIVMLPMSMSKQTHETFFTSGNFHWHRHLITPAKLFSPLGSEKSRRDIGGPNDELYTYLEIQYLCDERALEYMMKPLNSRGDEGAYLGVLSL